MSSRVRELLEEYTSKIEAEMKEELLSAINGVNFARVSSPIHRAPKAVAKNPGRRSKGEKRAPEQLVALQDTFLGFVAKNPGLRIEQINKQLGTTTKDLALPIRKLLSEHKIKATGHKRSTTYSAGNGAKRKKR